MHLVVVCPRCKGATAVREDQRSATCPRCGRSYDPRRSRAYHRSSDPAEVARLVGEMNARLERGFERYEADVRAAERGGGGPPGGLEDVSERVGRVKGLVRQLDEAVGLLCRRDPPEFTGVELATVLTAIGWEDWRVEESLARLLDEGRLTEVRPDVFRSV